RLKDPVVYLDLTHRKADYIKSRFPRIYETCLKHNIDLTIDLVPVRPAAHYLMGGVRTDLHGHSSLPGLYAAGETACPGVHGANRLASNSLLEGLVYGARAGRTMREAAGSPSFPLQNGLARTTAPSSMGGFPEDTATEIKNLMWNDVGIVRSRESLEHAVAQLESLRAGDEQPHHRQACEI